MEEENPTFLSNEIQKSNEPKKLLRKYRQICNDKELFLMALKKFGYSFFRFASETIKNDYYFVLYIVSKIGCQLKFLSPELQDNLEIVDICVAYNGDELEYASVDKRNNFTPLEI
jgi:hypothetical protein